MVYLATSVKNSILQNFYFTLLYRLSKFRLEISSIDKNDEDKLLDDFINKLNDFNLFTF